MEDVGKRTKENGWVGVNPTGEADRSLGRSPGSDPELLCMGSRKKMSSHTWSVVNPPRGDLEDQCWSEVDLVSNALAVWPWISSCPFSTLRLLRYHVG